ncbi:MAG: ACT domain-containing protein, partial [Candidatus Omnitrophica bacterium]|nr:ACT domain-containing protein [Candidatus Omnitrophota bacterium]
DVIKFDISPFTLSIIKGMLTPILQETVNFVNSMVIAKERGIRVIETKIDQIQDFANLIMVDVETDRMRSSLTGTLFTKVDPRIVKIDDFYVDAVPEGYMLFMQNKDVPGIIGQIGTILGRNNINIAGMSFGRESKGGKAVSVLNIDSDVPKNVLEELRKAQNVYGVKLVKL